MNAKHQASCVEHFLIILFEAHNSLAKKYQNKKRKEHFAFLFYVYIFSLHPFSFLRPHGRRKKL